MWILSISFYPWVYLYTIYLKWYIQPNFWIFIFYLKRFIIKNTIIYEYSRIIGDDLHHKIIWNTNMSWEYLLVSEVPVTRPWGTRLKSTSDTYSQIFEFFIFYLKRRFIIKDIIEVVIYITKLFESINDTSWSTSDTSWSISDTSLKY